MEKLVPAIETALAGWETRVPTGRLNAFLGELVAAHPHPIRGGKQPRILFGTQAGTKPPRFVLFASGFLEARLPPLHRAPAARGVRLRGHPDPDLGAGAREARPQEVAGGARQPYRAPADVATAQAGLPFERVRAALWCAPATGR